jgi:glutamyl-Q tRNA(Asp) synthetase
MSNLVIGRFAPSPTGPLHLGSLVAAMASFLDAHTAGGRWLLRIEDLDGPREVPGAAKKIISDLKFFGFHWDEEILFQSQRSSIYAQALQALEQMTYPCTCSRTDQQTLIYDGRCRKLADAGATTIDPMQSHAIRLRVEGTVSWSDRSGQAFFEHLATTCGDFVLQRKDKLWAYQLAVVVDDALQGITHVVRGADLLDSTARQIYLQRLLGFPTPEYWHVPVVLAPSGEKLSKQTGALALNLSKPIDELQVAWGYLSPFPIKATSVDDFWHQAKAAFQAPTRVLR